MQQIGKYQVIEQIGVGGFGEVFKGFDPYIKRYVAIKTCSSRSEEIRSRFFQEAEIAGNLHHRNITTVYDFGVENELPYLIQEYLSGEDLDLKIRRQDYLPFAEKLFYLIQIARGLSAAHAEGVMHRDIKPANVRVLEDGTVKIMDFGIAKLAQQETGLTQTGMTLGTAAYLSPEQIRGDAMDVRTDIFSFGVLAYELLAYERPFQGEQISAVLYQLLNNDPRPITEFWPGAPAEVVELLDRCLQKKPERRFQDGGDLMRALEELQQQGRRSSGRTSRPAAVEPPTVRLDSGGGAARPGLARPGLAQPGLSRSDLARPDSGRKRKKKKGSGLDEIDLTAATPTADHEPALTHAETPRHRSDARRTSGTSPLGLTLAVGALLVLIAGIGGWWLGNRGPQADVGPTAETAEPEVEDVGGATGADGDDGSVAPQGNLAGDVDGEPEKPVALKGRLRVPKPGWTDAMTVRVGGGKTWPLTRERSFRLDPGTYDLHFAVADGGFEAQKSVRARVDEGGDHRVGPPIAQPAVLTVVASPGRPQGEVTAGGRVVGRTPLRRLLLEPATYVVEIRPVGADGSEEPLSQNLTLRSGRESIVTFDLDGRRMRVSEKAASGR